LLLIRHIIGDGASMENILENPIIPALQQYTEVLDKEEVADILQNDVSQTLAAVLLWLQTAMSNKEIADNLHLQLAESNLKDSIKKLVRLHYALLK